MVDVETHSKEKLTNPFYFASNAEQEMAEMQEDGKKGLNLITGVLAIIEHGLQQFIMHLNPWTMASIAFPLNRNDYNN